MRRLHLTRPPFTWEAAVQGVGEKIVLRLFEVFVVIKRCYLISPGLHRCPGPAETLPQESHRNRIAARLSSQT